MPINIIDWQGDIYPAFQASHNSARFIMPFAQEICKGEGLDIGCGKKEWAFPGAQCIDPALYPEHHAMSLPEGKKWDYIFSSHCLEHVDKWVEVLDYWYECLKHGGVIFLYLPDSNTQTYWRPWNNRKHVHYLTPEILGEYMRSKYVKVMVSGVDLNNSFVVVGEK